MVSREGGPTGGVAAVIVAAGSGVRFGGALAKQYRMLGDRTVIRHTVERVLAHPVIDRVQLVINPANRALLERSLAGLIGREPRLAEPVAGGDTRQASVLAGLEALKDSEPAHVLIHDAARPLVTAQVVDRVLAGLESAPAVISSVPATDTLRRVTDGRSAGTIDRTGLWHAQTPQGFHFAAILAAHRAHAGDALTDDGAVAEASGLAVTVAEGDPDNIKLTTEADLVRAASILAAQRPAAGAQPARVSFRSGIGYDVHRLEPADGIILCGVHIDHDHGLSGHSDADVGLHAITDAILGALACGDIGQHFPPSDPQWKGADSARFLEHAAHLAAVSGATIEHIDVTLICERPKIGPHRARMTDRIAEILGIEPASVGVKATTTERLGFTGRGEGIAAQAVATLRIER